MPVEILLQLAALGIFFTHYWQKLPETHLSVFLLTVACVNLYRYGIVFYLHYFTDSKAHGHGLFATINFLLANFLCGLIWGGGFVLLDMLDGGFSLSDSLAPVIIAGLVMASLAGSALWSWLFVAFAVPVLLSPLGWILIQEHYAESALWGQLLVVAILTGWGSVRAEQAFNRYRQHSRQNVGLIQELAETKQAAIDKTIELEQAHEKLKIEIEERKIIEEKIRGSEKETARILADMQDTYFQANDKGFIKRLSPSVQSLVGYTPESLHNTSFLELFVNKRDYNTLIAAMDTNDGSVQNFEAKLKTQSGTTIWASINAHYAASIDNTSHGFEGTMRDVTTDKESEEKIFQEKERLHVTLESIGDGVIATDPHGKLTYLNPVAEKMTGWDEKEAVGKTLGTVLKLLEEKSNKPYEVPVANWLKQNQRVRLSNPVTLVNRKKTREYTIEFSGSPLRDSDGIVIGLVFVFHNVTKLRTLTKQLSFQATHDALTGLINRREFETRVKQAIKSAQQDNKNHAMFYVDLDQFKVVNDTCGHYAGDELLKQLTSRLQRLLRESDTLARLGGDEFGVLLVGCPLERARDVAEKIRADVEQFRFHWEERIFRIGTSIGLVPINAATRDLTELLSAADSACYVAKEGGRNQVHTYKPDDKAIAQQQGQMQWLQRIQKALENDLFELHFQSIIPVKNEKSSRLCGEVLLRMIDESSATGNRCLPPSSFIPAAERYQVMPKIDRWVLSKTFELLSKQKDILQYWDLCNINLSAQSLGDPKILDFILYSLKKTGLPPDVLCFEITESSVMSNLEEAHVFMMTLQKLGCKFALDDFGTGLSSFSYLKNLPVDYVKLDGELVRDVAKDDTSYAMVEAINRVAHVMGIKTIAEHVETVASINALRKISVDYAQGFVIDTPQAFPHISEQAEQAEKVS
ncbi:MAG: EAL domain-containing protein [Gammaproteobacteria bacterium]|jgi:diguanylate cyclase (GGDEF)-like protein/PAS domain S-box-containing protein